ncbi:hypothetical protein [Arthrospiribacter ruber]|uniref:Uncharacterized protein n=1 Tax=Arthrospiribacter ruber TaxID=2487934 RepID=A0A951IXP2_9BACT|nr:hypothetical protein [Arthrospiribacter ruber]MBW3469095.1 hypothetical protein [Arthrospiribacter ruber]
MKNLQAKSTIDRLEYELLKLDTTCLKEKVISNFTSIALCLLLLQNITFIPAILLYVFIGIYIMNITNNSFKLFKNFKTIREW